MSDQVLDNTPRYLPKTLMTKDGEGVVVWARFYPPGCHPADCPLLPDVGAVEAIVALPDLRVHNRWFGCQRAYVDSTLRMVVIGTDPRDEVRMAWEVVS